MNDFIAMLKKIKPNVDFENEIGRASCRERV